MNVPVRKGWVAGACLVAFLASTGVTWYTQTRATERAAAEMLVTTSADVKKEVMESVNDMLFFIGNAICRHYRRPEAMTGDGVKEVMSRYDIDEINVVNDKGIVIAGAVADLGFDMGSKPLTAEFNRLLHGVKTYCQGFRGAVEDPTLVRKYAGIAFPDAKGYVQIGFDRKRLRDDVNYRFETSIAGRHVGETGFFVCANEETGEIDTCGHAGFKPGDTLAGIGLDVAALAQHKPTEVFEATLYGIPCLCVHDAYAYRHMIAALPLREMWGGRNISVLMMTAILFAVFTLVAVFTMHLTELVARLKVFIATEQARQQQDLSVARTIQTSALPIILPEQSDYRIYAMMDTAREVGGDFYDFYELPDDRVFFMIADVSGKGVPAAMFMMRAKAVVKASVLDSPDLAAAAIEANNRLSEQNDAEMFVTAWMGIFNRRDHHVEYVNAGHNPPLVKRADGSVAWLKGKRGLVFAAMAGAKYTVQECMLNPGDSILLYTDGVTEAVNTELELYGEKRLEETLFKASELFVTEIQADVEKFSEGAEQADDISMVALDVKRVAPKRFESTPQGLEAATDYIEERLNRVACAPADVTKFLIAFDEMGSNVMRYSGAPYFEVAVWRAKEVAALEISDEGVAWNPLEKPDPDVTLAASERAIGGLGIFMTKKLMDHLEYRRASGRNIVTLRRKTQGSEGDRAKG